MFYNGLKACEPYYVASGSRTLATNEALEAFPYFDNYSGANTTTSSLSLLFFNEEAPYGVQPTASLYTQYWEDYVELLYNPRTRLLNASAIIPLADYFKMELNDIVEFRGNYYHLRAINDYSLKNGECKIQLLGPILRESANVEPVTNECDFSFSSSIAPITTTTSTTSTTSTTTLPLVKYRAEFYLCSGGGCVLQSFTTIQGSELIINKYYRIENGNIFRPIELSTASLATTIVPVSVSDTCNPLCAAPTTTTTTVANLCRTYRVTNGAGNGSLIYTPCGTSVSQSFFIPANTQYNLCVYNNLISTTSPNVTLTNLGTTCSQTPSTCQSVSLFNPTGVNQTFQYVACNDTQCNATLNGILAPGATRVICVKPQSLSAGSNIATTVGSCSSSCFLPINIAPTTTTTSTTTTSTTTTTTLPPTTTTTTTVNCNFDFTVNNTTPITATGGRVGRFVSGGIEYQYHDFTTSGTLSVQSGFTNQAQILVVAGGGAGGQNAGGGGGGIIYRNNITLTQNNYTAQVGSGGTPFSNGSGGVFVPSTNGGNSQFTPTWVAIGGGKAGYYSRSITIGTNNGSSGGSGGGANSDSSLSSATGGSGTLNQGFAGGNVTGPNSGGGGGSYISTGSANTSIGGKGAFFELGALVNGFNPGFDDYVRSTDFAGGGGNTAIAWDGSTRQEITSGGSKSRLGVGRDGRNGQGGGASAGTRVVGTDTRGYAGGSGRVIVVYPYIPPYTPISASYLAVAGGGQGGYINSTIYTLGNVSDVCGGGAGGFLSGSIIFQTSGSYQITVGTGGNRSGDRFAGASGGNSSIGFDVLAFGGGGGSAVYDVTPPFNSINRGSNGGSGGGATGLTGDNTALTGVAGQGFAGGVGLVQNSDAAGGGGAGGVGNAGQGNNGGIGRTSSISGTLTTYSKGGNGRTSNPGVINTEVGSGGRGEWAASSVNTRAVNGIVIIRYPGSQKATGGTITQSGGDTIHTFTSNGVFTPIQGI
jgi:hypothetical protein